MVMEQMRVIARAEELSPGARKVCAAIGVFDGVHLGHQQVIRQTVADARQVEGVALVITFDRHPSSVVAPERTPPLIYSLPQKLRAIESLGAEATLLIEFTREFSQIPAEEFIRQLAHQFGSIYSLCVGSAFTFGHKRGGNVELLRRLGQELNFIVHGISSLALDGKIVSSTRIREAIKQGRLDAASQMIGRSYSVAGKVVRGDGIGRQLGFPTANIDCAALLLPPNGVYAVHARTNGQSHRAVANIGLRPTLVSPAPRLQVEAHLLDFSGDLYGEELEIIFDAKLRDEQKFSSCEELTAQIARDLAEARRIFS
ncbi:MAG: bifunctional riboflavin kinase/FAD synthetase [Verrucomicrobia bacterium]|nr:bifunctional riboflavin kinase/FAD synthetase [Verrucomicrobiota bacterium]